jgi:hypothetical protein
MQQGGRKQALEIRQASGLNRRLIHESGKLDIWNRQMTIAKSLHEFSRTSPTIFPIAGGGCVRAYNETASKHPGDIIICASDDVYPFSGWDSVIELRLSDTSTPKFLLSSDGSNRKQMACAIQIITRGWLDHFGFIFHPRFKSVYGDDWMVERARRDGFLIPAPDIVFEHKHPLLMDSEGKEKAEWDDVYEAENAKERYAEGAKTFSELIEPMPISLCMICGNEQEAIINCLESAKGAFDELCLVRAVGDQTPDGTLDLAAKWCSENGKEVQVAEYRNATPMPHVDNFAAARNLSFGLASHPWILWLDCDDYLDEMNCRRIKEATKAPSFDALMCRYAVEKNGAEIYRERLIRRGRGKWKNAIHETCVINGSTWDNNQIVVYHSDHTKKHQSSAERNARILRGVLEDAPRHYFYLQAELKMLGKKDEALKAAKAAIALLESNRPEEIYNVRLNLSELEPAETVHHLHEAVKIQPHRREAFAYLCQKSMIDGDLSAAQSYFRQMDSLPLPSPIPWTHQGIWYGWARNALYVRLLRATGYNDQAEKAHLEFLKDQDYAEETKEENVS